uniref:Si:dkey-11m19.5 n=1 Tax=Lepisosteus oculatus TaxID=7918 RepID=W5N8P1_LEPOC
MLDLWDSFVPLLQVATETVSTRLPSMVETLNSIYTSLSEELQGLVSTATTGQYLQPSQCAAVVLEELKGIAQQFQTVAGKLYDLNRTSQSLTGSPLDLSFIPSTERKLEARKGVWELLSQATMQINEWKRILFSKFVVAHAQEKVNDWLNQASLLVQTLPAQDNVFKETMQLIENFSQQLPLLLKLSSPTLKHKHWRHIFKGLGLMYETEWHLTVADLLPKSLLEYQNSITKVWQDAKAEADMEQAFRKLQRRWNVEHFRLANFIVKVCTWTGIWCSKINYLFDWLILGICSPFLCDCFENLLALAEDSVMTLSNMMLSPHISEFRQEVENWVHLLQELEELLGFWQRYQQEWVFLSKIFYETEVSIQKPELFCRFRTVDSNYRDMMQATSCSPRVLNIVRHGKKTGTPGQFQGQCLRSVFMEELSTMEKISNQLLFLLDSPRCEFPRLNFLSDGDVIKLLSLHPNHSALLPLVRKCFPSVKELVLKTLDQQHHTMTSMDLSDLQMSVIGVNGNLGEKLPFSSPLPSNYNLLAWLSDLEQRMREAVFRLLWDCIVARMTPAPVTQTETWNQYKRSSDSDEFNDPSWDLTSQFPLQCLLVAEEVLWCKEIQSSFLNQTVVKRTRLKARYATKLKGLIQIIQEHSLRYGESLDSQRVMSAFKALVLVAMKHCDLMSRFLEQKTEVESSFEWQKLLKYSLNSDPKHSGLHAKLCYVDVLGSHIPYGYEYVGPDDWMIVNTPSSDRAVLGILLSLTSYRSSLVIGPSMSGKSKTVVHLGKVLGQQVVTLQYTREMSPSIVLQMLSGAIQTGAWLVLECVNVMTQGDLSLLGQYFSDIQRALTALQKNQQLRISQTKPYEPQSFGLISFAGRTCLAKHGYGCVLIMSGSTSEIPENLRVATRPISLIQPDYLIIAEVSLAALGFSEAQSLAHRLVCLLTLAQKSLCLPQFINNCTSWLVVLKNIITTAGIHLHEHHLKTLLLEAQDEEQAILKAISLVVVTAILDPEKVSHFQSLLEDIFSASPLQGTETDEIAILSSAVTQELQEIGLHSDQWTIKNVLSLYEALKLSRAVILVGPAGSGKTACYRTLVGALKSVTLKSKWSSVDTMVIFPNSVSEEEFSGICNHDEQHGGWWRAFTKILKDSERRDFSTRERQKSQTHKGKWVVLDGEPLAEGWMDQLSTLFDLEDPYLCFSSGQKVRPSPEQVKLLMEVTELASASPSTVTRCGIVYHSGKEVWKAIWKAELETLYREFSLDQTTLRLWNRLAEDLFSSTLSFLKHKALSPVLLEGSILSADKTTAHGVQEVMSFTRILHSFLEQYLIGKEAESPSTTKLEDPGNLLSQKHLQAKNIFVVSYVWGFGGHLHPKYWLRFDAFARKSLYESWYSIEIPQEGTVYDYLINQNEGTLEMMNTGLLNSRFEKYAYLLDVLLDSRQPALLVGETGAGKTTLSQSLLNYERPHVRLPITPCLRAADVRNVLENMWSPRAKLSAAGLSPAGSKQSCLFIDDLHHTTCDVGSKISSVLETLRQCMSKGGVLTSDGYHFKLLNSGAVSYLATCVSPECCSSMTICISPRFFRLFSVLTLPSLVTEHLLSIHSPRVLHWLKDLHITAVSQYTELASCIIGATVDLYSAVKENFPPHQQQPYLLFSYHDLQKVFQGMFLWTPRTTARQYPQISSTHGSLAAVLNITRLWIHECFRTFGDRLSSENEKRVLASLLNKVSQKYFCPKESDSQKTKGENESCAMPSENNQNSEKSEIILPLPDKDDQSEDIISSDSETCQDIIFSTNFCESLQSPTQQYSLKRSSVYQEKDMDLLIQQLSSLLQWQCREEMIDKGFVSGPESKLAIFRERVQQLTHILRVLLLPRGHAALFGMGKGTGRKTLVRFAVSFSGYRLYDVNPNNETEVSEILKEASDHAGVFGGRVVILVHEEVSQSVLDKLLAVMAEGTFPGLYNKDELSAAVQKITALTKNTKNRLGEEQVLERYYKHVQKNLHVFIMLSPKCQKHAEPLKEKMLSEIFLSRLLKLCSCVEMFQPLSAETLSEVAASRLQDVILPPEEEGKGEEACSLEVLTKSMATIHQSVLRYVTHQVPGLHLFSLQVFLEFTEHFRDIFTHLWQQARAQANRVATILRRLKILTNTAKQSSQEVLFVRNELKVAQELQQQLQREVDAQRILCEQTRQRCLQEENILSDLSEQLQQAQHESQEAFQQAALDALHSLTVADIEEIRCYRVPPDGVVMVMNAVCLMFGRPRNWESSKQLIGQTSFFQDLEFYDKSGITDSLFTALGRIVVQPEFQPAVVREASRACESLCLWLHSIYQYASVQRHLAPQHNRVHQVEEHMVKSRIRLGQERVQEEAARECLEELEKQYQGASQHVGELTLQLRHADAREREAHSAAQLMHSHITNWTAAAKKATEDNHNAVGDALVLAAAASYLGPFNPDVRLEMLEKWQELCHTGEMQLNPRDQRHEVLPTTVPPVPRNIVLIPVSKELPLSKALGGCVSASETFSHRPVLQLVIRRSRCPFVQRWPLLVGSAQQAKSCAEAILEEHLSHLDLGNAHTVYSFMLRKLSQTQSMAHPWTLYNSLRMCLALGVMILVIAKATFKECFRILLFAEDENLYLPESSSQPDTWMVLCADDPTLVEKIQKGAERGLVVLVTDVERVVLSPKLLDFLQRKPEKWASGLRTDSMAAHHHFTLFLSTHLPVRALAQELDSNILKVVNVIDISLSQSELEELLLKELVLSECPEVWGQRRTVQMEKLQIVNRMQEVEDSLVEYILQSLTPLLEDPCFLSHVSECQKTMSVLHQDLKEVSVELQHHCVLLKDFDGVVKLGSALYQALQEVSRLSPLYFFPLQPFLQLFKVALGHNGRTEGANGGEFTSATMAEITHRIVSDVLSHYRPCLFQSHARFFQLLVSVALIRHNDECTSLEQQIFLKGLKDVVSSLDLHSTSTHLVKWVDEHTMREICYLENLTAFKGLSSSLLHLSEQWQEYFKFPSSTVIGPVPCSSYAQLSTLQKAVLWKTLHPEWLFAVAEDLAYTQLGQTLASVDYATTEISSQLLNLPAIPVIFLLPQKGDLGPSTHPLYWIEQAVKTQANQVRIHVISFGSHCQRESTLHTLDTCTRGGHWLVFNNCHLLDQWDSELVSQLSKLFSQTARGRRNSISVSICRPASCGERPIHPQFRLWFITRSDAPQSIPGVQEQHVTDLNCIKTTVQCGQVEKVSLRQAAAGPCPPADLQIRCAVLHSVLLQRQNYRQIAQGHLHCWTQEDLLAVLNAWEKIERLCEDPVQALEFIAGRNVYQRLRKLNLVCQVDKYSFTRLW